MKHKIIECGCCGGYHRVVYYGDCRNDAERYADPEDYAERNHINLKEVIEVFEDGSESEVR